MKAVEIIQLKCKKCASAEVSRTYDGAGLGLRDHCLACGHVEKVEVEKTQKGG
jgi:uncharacterized Zn finger protein